MNPQDISACGRLLDDPKILTLAKSVARHPSFNEMADRLKKTIQEEDGNAQRTEEYDYGSTVQKVLKIPALSTMTEELGKHKKDDPCFGSLLCIQTNPSLKNVTEEFEVGGASTVMRHWDNKDALHKLAEAMNFKIAREDAESVGNVAILHRAASDGDLEALKKALSDGADCTEVDVGGRTALHFACGNNKVECAKMLIEAGVLVDALDKEKNTPLHYAAASGGIHCAMLLILKEASITYQNLEANTPIDIARSKNHKDIEDLLDLVEGFEMEPSDCPLLIMNLAYQDYHEMLKIALDVGDGAYKDVADGAGQTALHHACANGNHDSAKILIEAGVNVNALDKAKNTALHLAASGNWRDCVILLLDNGVHVGAINAYGKHAADLAPDR